MQRSKHKPKEHFTVEIDTGIFFLKEEKKERVMVKMDNTLPKVWLFITVLVDFIYFSLPFTQAAFRRLGF